MRLGNTKQRTYALGICAFVAVGGWLLAEGTDKKAHKVTSAAATPAFRPCHPPGGDLSRDGKWFVTLQQEQPTIGLLEIGPEQTNRSLPLPKPAVDAVFLDATRVVVSFGLWGEIAVLDTQQATVDAPWRVGASAGALCSLADGRVVVLDAKQQRLHIVDPQAKVIGTTLPVPPKTAQLGWAVPELTLEVADSLGKRLGTIDLPRPSVQAQGGAL